MCMSDLWSHITFFAAALDVTKTSVTTKAAHVKTEYGDVLNVPTIGLCTLRQ